MIVHQQLNEMRHMNSVLLFLAVLCIMSVSFHSFSKIALEFQELETNKQRQEMFLYVVENTTDESKYCSFKKKNDWHM